jgi:hypothetical protein
VSYRTTRCTGMPLALLGSGGGERERFAAPGPLCALLKDFPKSTVYPEHARGGLGT